MKIFFNPFEKYPEKALLALGVLFLLLGSFTGYIFNARYDGILDTHFVSYTTVQPFIDIVINTVSLFIVFYAAGKYINSKTRPIDILNIALIAPAPFYLLPFFNINSYLYTISHKLTVVMGFHLGEMKTDPETILNAVGTSEIIAILLFSIFALATIVWFVILLYNGYKTATNLKTTAQKIFFGIGILIAEVISKLLINIIPY